MSNKGGFPSPPSFAFFRFPPRFAGCGGFGTDWRQGQALFVRKRQVEECLFPDFRHVVRKQAAKRDIGVDLFEDAWHVG